MPRARTQLPIYLRERNRAHSRRAGLFRCQCGCDLRVVVLVEQADQPADASDGGPAASDDVVDAEFEEVDKDEPQKD